MKYTDIENAMVSRLQTKLGPGVVVIPLPEFQNDNKRPTDKPRVTVVYNHSAFDGCRYGASAQSAAVDSIVQEESLQFKVAIESRLLRGETGIYELLVAVRQSLIGQSFLGLDPLMVLDSKFDDYKENLWSYTLTFMTKGWVVSEIDSTNDPLITAVGFDDNYIEPNN